MPPRWKDVRCACMPVEHLPVLAELRGQSEIRVSIAADRAWIWWETETDWLQDVLARRILPLRGVELFTERGGRWYRLGEHLPAFGVPAGTGSPGVLLERMILPTPLKPEPPPEGLPEPVRLRLVRDKRSLVRPASAFRCALATLVDWVNGATSAQLAPLQAAWSRESHGVRGDAGSSVVLVLGDPGSLPLLSGGTRFWGTDLLIPLGFRADPDLPEEAIRTAVGAGASDLVVLDQDGFELLDRGVFRPLCRAGIRLAWEGKHHE
jgi:hypothetical protein